MFLYDRLSASFVAVIFTTVKANNLKHFHKQHIQSIVLKAKDGV